MAMRRVDKRSPLTSDRAPSSELLQLIGNLSREHWQRSRPVGHSLLLWI